MNDSAVYCKECGEPLDGLVHDAEEREPCPECGVTSRRFVESIEETIVVDDELGGATIRVREWIEKNWFVLPVTVVLTAGGYLLEGPAGLIVGIVASFIGGWALTRVREREIERF